MSEELRAVAALYGELDERELPEALRTELGAHRAVLAVVRAVAPEPAPPGADELIVALARAELERSGPLAPLRRLFGEPWAGVLAALLTSLVAVAVLVPPLFAPAEPAPAAAEARPAAAPTDPVAGALSLAEARALAGDPDGARRVLEDALRERDDPRLREALARLLGAITSTAR